MYLDQGPYRGSRKEPDYFLRPEGETARTSPDLHTLAIESGWSETLPLLHDDMNMLLIGGNGEIKIVIILNWRRLSGLRVAGDAELWMNDATGMPQLKQREVRMFKAL